MHHAVSHHTDWGYVRGVWRWVGMTYLVMIHAQDSDGLAELVFQTAAATAGTAAGAHSGNQEEATATTDVLPLVATGDGVLDQLAVCCGQLRANAHLQFSLTACLLHCCICLSFSSEAAACTAVNAPHES